MSDRRETWLVGMARAGHQRAVEELIERYWPLIYNIAGHGLGSGAELERVLRRTVEQIEREVPDLPDPRLVRAWAVGTALGQVRRVRRPGRSTVGRSGAAAEPDFAAVAIEQLGLTGPARQLVEATRWLSPYDRDVLPIWWLAQLGELDGEELATALDLPAPEATARTRRMRDRLDTAREVVVALAAEPACAELIALAGAAAHQPAPHRRDQLARHIRQCRRCAGHRITLAPAEHLLTGIGLVPPPDLPAYRALWGPAGGGAATTGVGPVALGAAAGPGTPAGPARRGWSGLIGRDEEADASAATGNTGPAPVPATSGLAALGLVSRVPAGWEVPEGAGVPAAVGVLTPGAVPPSGARVAGAGVPGARVPGAPPPQSVDGPPLVDGSAPGDGSTPASGSGPAPSGRLFRSGGLRLRRRILLGLVGSALGAVAIIALLPTQRPAPPPAGRPVPPPPVLDSAGPTTPAAAPGTASPSAPAAGVATPRRPAATPTPRRPAAPPAAPFHVSYEAEAARRHGDAEVASLRAASGGKIVQRIGTEQQEHSYGGWQRFFSAPERNTYRRWGALEFTATVPASGRYEMTVFYVSGERRDAYLRIGDDPLRRLSFSGRGDWDSVQSARFTVELRGGANSLVFGNPWDWAPRLDRITLAD